MSESHGGERRQNRPQRSNSGRRGGPSSGGRGGQRGDFQDARGARGGQGGRGQGGRGRDGQGGYRGRDGDSRSQGREGDARRSDRSEHGGGDRPKWGGDRNSRGSQGGGRGSYGSNGNRGRGGFAGSGGRGGQGGPRRHSNRAGQDRDRDNRTGPQRAGYREERMAMREAEPKIPEDIRADELDPSVTRDLRSLAKDNAETVARHMIAAAAVMADDPQRALEHARAAKNRAGRVAVVRETAGIAAYHAGEWKEALSELRAARRMYGGPGLLAVMADCERGLGRPDKAIEIGRSDEARELSRDEAIELAIVLAGARRDLDQPEAALMELERMNPEPTEESMAGARLDYAYADALLTVGDTAGAKQWFGYAAKADTDEMLDAEDRLAELDNPQSAAPRENTDGSVASTDEES